MSFGGAVRPRAYSAQPIVGIVLSDNRRTDHKGVTPEDQRNPQND
jgi:hypothetical protein